MLLSDWLRWVFHAVTTARLRSLLTALGISIGMDWVGEIVTGTVGALVLLIVLGYVQKTVNSGSST